MVINNDILLKHLNIWKMSQNDLSDDANES